MKVAILGIVALCAGMVGTVVFLESKRERPRSGEVVVAGETPDVKTISTGEAVDINRHVPQTGFTIVEFTGDF
ncbi:MAG: hypothetical protein IPK26_12140 [Planctomycetes bacterium]|nr:hypothetical protein [Planctomycetota bacterium]